MDRIKWKRRVHPSFKKYNPLKLKCLLSLNWWLSSLPYLLGVSQRNWACWFRMSQALQHLMLIIQFLGIRLTVHTKVKIQMPRKNEWLNLRWNSQIFSKSFSKMKKKLKLQKTKLRRKNNSGVVEKIPLKENHKFLQIYLQ